MPPTSADNGFVPRPSFMQLYLRSRLPGQPPSLLQYLAEMLGSLLPCQPHAALHLRGASSSLRPVGEGLADLVGNTPLIRIRSLSEQTGCEVGAAAGGDLSPVHLAPSSVSVCLLLLSAQRAWPLPVPFLPCCTSSVWPPSCEPLPAPFIDPAACN